MNAHPSPAESIASDRKGLFYAVAAFVCWGLFPMYWRLLANVPAIEVVCHRIVWSFIFLSVVVGASRWRETQAATKQPPQPLGTTALPSRRKIGLIYTLAAILISINWLIFIWAVNSGRVLEASLGYYINPLLSVVLGVLCFGERLSMWQVIAIGIAAIGVLVMTVAGGVMPWVSLSLAASFAFYGLVKKAAPLSSMAGLWIETTVLLLPALGYLLAMEFSGTGAIRTGNASSLLLLALGGCVTVLPLALFATAAQRVPLSTIGVLQYIAPTLQFALGVFAFGEPFGTWRLIGFALVWIGSLAFLITGRRLRQ